MDSPINFNGVDEYETFNITQQKGTSSNFCKTNQKPYDLAVAAVLLILNHHAPNHFNIRSDGGLEGMLDAAHLNFKLFEYGFKIPESLSKSEEAIQLEKTFEAQLRKNKLEPELKDKLNSAQNKI